MPYCTPTIHPQAKIARNATVIGNVSIGAESVILFGAILRGDCGQRIVIGDRTNIQDGAVIHVAYGFDSIVGSGVSVGHNAIIHGATVDDDSLIGMGATILDGAHVPRHCLVGANALVTASAQIPEGSLVLGSPARVVRPLTAEEIESLHFNAEEYRRIGQDLLEEGYLEEGRATNGA